MSHRPLSLVLGLLILAVCVGWAAKDGVPRFSHASLAAYPDAVVSVKDAKTGMTFYVESDGRKLIALDRDGSIAWGLDVIAEAKVPPVVRRLKLDGDSLWALCGKKDFVRIDVKTGVAKYEGSD